jgi:transcriptional regulator with XRE-family HTH domain
MPVHKQLKAVRLLKGWSQEKMAEKLGYSKNGYAKIERGETGVSLAKIERMAKLLDVDFQELAGMKEGNIFNVVENCTHAHTHGNVRYNIVLSETECAHELEKATLLLQERDKQINHLTEENAQLKKIIELLELRPVTKIIDEI